ncbi:MAG TPA: response regulator, partial [Armatimonadota bacterium]|nr:response regulator [Armatimonadota bacterium]
MNSYVEPMNHDEPRSAIRILVVDDEEGARQTLTDVLEEMGYLICTAANAAEALRTATAQEFDIALIDVRLPDMVGTELLRQLKAKHPDLACVIVTAYASVSSSVEALNEGASAYVVKPFEIPTLVTVIREQAEKQHLARENRRMLQVLTALQEISEIALATPDLETLAGKLLDRIIDAFGGSGGAMVVDKEEALTSIPGLILRGNAAGTAAKRAPQEGALLLLPDINAAKKVAVPLSVHDEVIGGLQINAPADRYFTQRDLRLATLLADRVALALENARLHERERRSAREAQTLFHVAEALVSTLHLNDRLDVIARTLAGVSGCSRCLVFLRRDRALAPAWAFGLSEDEAETFSAMGTDLLRIEGSLKRAVETRQTLLMQDAGEDPDVSQTFLNLWHIQTALVLPLVIGTVAIGVVLLDTPGTEYQVSEHDIRLCEAVANQAAVAIENARAFERERTVAEVLQKSFLPSVPEHLGALSLTARYYAALAEAQVGGDFYDVIEFPDGRIGLLMADVSGKGVSAAVHAAMGKYMLRAYS